MTVAGAIGCFLGTNKVTRRRGGETSLRLILLCPNIPYLQNHPEEPFMKHTIALKQNHEFRRLYSKGKSAVSPYFAVYCRKTNRPVSRLGITTGVKLGNAVKRNRARRRIRELYRTNEHRLLPGYDVVVVARARVIYGRYPELERSFLQLMRKLGICPPREARP